MTSGGGNRFLVTFGGGTRFLVTFGGRFGGAGDVRRERPVRGPRLHVAARTCTASGTGRREGRPHRVTRVNLSPVLIRRRDRVAQIVRVAHRYGLADWVARAERLGLTERVAARFADPELVEMSQGERLRSALTDLGTTWIKFGQMLSLRPDIVGEDVARALEKLHADVRPDAPGTAQRLIEAELGRPIDELFRSFDLEPFASASVAQVHRATAHDGTPLAVKVLHDGARAEVLADLALMRALAEYLDAHDPEIARYRPVALVDEFARMMRRAVDFGEELRNLEQFGTDFADEADLVVPRPFRDLSSGAVLTMTYIDGPSLTSRAAVESAGWDVDALITRIADVYLKMVFRDAVFHADPHPRNFLLPGPHYFAILDFGDVGRVSRLRRRQLQSVAIALAARDTDQLADVLIDLTMPPPGTDFEQLRADIDSWLGESIEVDVADLDVAGLLVGAMRLMHHHRLVLPADLVLILRVLARLQGLARNLGSNVQIAAMLEPYVGGMVVERYDPEHLLHRARRVARSWERLLSSLPDELQAMVAHAGSGKLGVDIRVHDADQQVDHLVDGMVAAASLLASSQMLSTRTWPSVRGVSLPGVAAGAVAALTWRRLVAKRPDRPSLVQLSRRLLRQ
jgi:ubiquinone biosynthesis protein